MVQNIQNVSSSLDVGLNGEIRVQTSASFDAWSAATFPNAAKTHNPPMYLWRVFGSQGQQVAGMAGYATYDEAYAAAKEFATARGYPDPPIPVAKPGIAPVVPVTPTEVAAGPEPFDWNAFWAPVSVPEAQEATSPWTAVEAVVDSWSARVTSWGAAVEYSFTSSGDYGSGRGSSW